MEPTRRGFLIGLGAALAATAVTHKIITPELLVPSTGKRTSFRFDVFANPLDPTPEHDQLIDVLFSPRGEVRYLQVEWGALHEVAFPTSYIRTTDEPATRAAESGQLYPKDGAWDFRNGRFEIERPSPAFLVDNDGTLKYFAPHVPRLTEEGLLVEEERTNLIRYSDDPPSQVLRLRPGRYALTFYGKGTVSVRGANRDLVVAEGQNYVLSIAHWSDRRLSNADLKRLTE